MRNLAAIGTTVEEKADLLTAQGNRCATCGSADPRCKTWCFDHNHNTGELRGILCNPCNLILGFYEKYNIPVSQEFVMYLKNPPAREALGLKLRLITGGKGKE